MKKNQFYTALILAAALVVSGLYHSHVAEAQNPSAPIKLRAPYQVIISTTPQPLASSTAVHGIVLKAISPGATIYIGTSSALTATDGYPLSDGDTLTLEVREASEIYAMATATARLAIMPYRRN